MIDEPGDMIILSPTSCPADAIDAAKPSTLTVTFRYDSQARCGAKPANIATGILMTTVVAACCPEFFAKEVRCDFVAPPGIARDRPVK